MQRVGVGSSGVAAPWCSRRRHSLDAEARPGATHRSHGVPRHEFQDLLQAPSTGARSDARVRPLAAPRRKA